MKDHEEKVPDTMDLQKFYKMYKVLCFSTTTKTLTSAGNMWHENIASLTQMGRRDLEKKQHAKKNHKTLELEQILLSDTDLQYKRSLLVQAAKGFWNQYTGTYCTIMLTD